MKPFTIRARISSQLLPRGRNTAHAFRLQRVVIFDAAAASDSFSATLLSADLYSDAFVIHGLLATKRPEEFVKTKYRDRSYFELMVSARDDIGNEYQFPMTPVGITDTGSRFALLSSQSFSDNANILTITMYMPLRALIGRMNRIRIKRHIEKIPVFVFDLRMQVVPQ